jgi:hypothetical protein
MANRTVRVRLHANSASYIAAMKAASAATRDLHNEIDKTNDRTAWLAQGILAVAPAATTMGAAAVPMLSGMATQMTVAAGAAGVMALGFNGVGDALGALNDYQLDPTEENLEKLSEAMDKVGREGEKFVRFLDSLSPQFRELANTSREGMFPGVTRGIREFMDLAPQLNLVIDQVAKGVGQLGRDAGRGLSGEGFADFFNYLENEARPTLVQFGRTMGNFIEGIANMIVAFGPLSADFSKGFLEMSRSFVEWSDGLSSSSGFAEFVDYVRTAGPLALDFLSSLGNAFVEILEAAAPIGQLMLPALTAMFDIIANLADTPLGPVVIGFAALTSAWGRLNAVAAITGSGVMAKATAGLRGNLATAKMLTPSVRELGTAFAFAGQGVQFQSKQTRLALTQTRAFAKSIAPVAGQVALLGVAMSGVAESAGMSNTAMLALAGSMGGKYGAAVGTAVGLVMDFAETNDSLTASLDSASEAMDRAFGSKAGTTDMEALEASVEAARQKYIELVDEVEAGGITGLKFRVESLLGENDVEDAYAELMRLAEELGIVQEREAQASRERAADKSYYNSIQAETAVLEDNIEAMRAKREEAMTGVNAELDYQEALLDTGKAAKEYAGVLKDNGQLMPGLRREGIEAKRELTNLAGAWNGLSDEAQNTPGRFEKAREKFIELATGMGMSRRAAKRLADELMNIPMEIVPTVGIDWETARRHIRAIKRELKSLESPIYTDIRVPNASGFGAQITRADGGDIPGPRYPYGDKVLVAAAPSEFMVSNRYGQADKNREELKAANAGAKLAVVGYADGGTIGATGRSVAAGRSYPAPRASYASTSGGAAIDYDRLASAMLLARPLYGDVNISGDPSEFKRQMLHDEQATGIGGFGG